MKQKQDDGVDRIWITEAGDTLAGLIQKMEVDETDIEWINSLDFSQILVGDLISVDLDEPNLPSKMQTGISFRVNERQHTKVGLVLKCSPSNDNKKAFEKWADYAAIRQENFSGN